MTQAPDNTDGRTTDGQDTVREVREVVALFKTREAFDKAVAALLDRKSVV